MCHCLFVSCLPHEDGVRPRYVPASVLCRNLLNGTGSGFSRTWGNAGSSISNPFDCFFLDIFRQSMTHTHFTYLRYYPILSDIYEIHESDQNNFNMKHTKKLRESATITFLSWSSAEISLKSGFLVFYLLRQLH